LVCGVSAVHLFYSSQGASTAVCGLLTMFLGMKLKR